MAARRRRIAAIAIVALAALPASAVALSPPAPPTDAVAGAQVALDAQGRGLAVWSQYVASTDVSTIEVAERRRDGTWRPPFRIAWAKDGSVGAPRIAVNARGDAVVIWDRSQPSGRRSIEAATRPAGGGFSAPHELAGPDEHPGLATVAIGERGDIVVAWGTFGDEESIVTTSRPAGGTWGAPQRISQPGRWLEAPSVAVGRDGQAVVAWGRGDVLYESVVQLAERPPGGAFGSPLSLSPSLVTPGSSGHEPSVAITPDGESLVAWITAAGPNDARVPVVAKRPPGGSWTEPEAIGAPETLDVDPFGQYNAPPAPRIAVGDDGSAHLLWARRGNSASQHTLQWAARAKGGGWSPPTAAGPPRSYSVDWADLAVGGAGAAALWWEGDAGYRAASLIAGSGLGAGESVPLPTGPHGVSNPDLALGGRGAAVAVGATRRLDAPAVLSTTRSAEGTWTPPVALSSLAAPSPDEVEAPAACAAGPAARRVPAKATTRRGASAAQLLAANRRIAQAAIRRAAAVTALLNSGLGPEHLRDGSFCAAAFAGEVWTAGGGTAGAVKPGKRIPLPAVTGGRVEVERASAARLRADALLVQTAMRRANALVARLDAGLTGRDIRDGAIGAAELAAGLEIDGSVAGGAPPAGRSVAQRRATKPRVGRLSAERLIVNRRIAQAALRRVNEVRDRIARGLTGADFRPGSVGLRDLDPNLRD